jgi:RHS repeat-associated protein
MSSPTDASGCYGLTWTYDAWANRTNQTTSSGACTESHPTIAPNNQFTGTPYQYDAAGNMTQDASHSYTYDAENRLTTVDGGSTATYVYDAEGDRIEKIAGGVTTVYYYDPVGNLTTETNGGDTLNIGYVYSGGQLLAEYEGGSTLFVHKDHLGSTRVMTAMNGSVSDSMDYLPYGELLSGGGSTTHKFTGKERDAESGLDNFGARYFSSSAGRFETTDDPGADQHPEEPQSWNMYSYVRNNPLGNIDPDGRACSGSLLNTDSGYCQRADLYANLDALVHEKTRFFAAASATSQDLADTAVFGLGRIGTSPKTRAFLEKTGEALEALNVHMAGAIITGNIRGEGPSLDAQLVHKEQNEVQNQLNIFKGANPGGYKTAINEINTLLNSKDGGGAVLKALVGGSKLLFGSDKAYSQILDEVRSKLGHKIDFSNQKDREAIGNAVANYIRKTGGCDVTGNKAKGCKES